MTPNPIEEILPTILELSAPRKIYPKETVIAEKFEAMVKLGIANSRMKDFWDVSYLIKEFELDRDLVRKAIQATFVNRRTAMPKTLPVALTDDFADNQLITSRWQAFIKRNRIKTDTELKVIIKRLRKFLPHYLTPKPNKSLEFLSALIMKIRFDHQLDH